MLPTTGFLTFGWVMGGVGLRPGEICPGRVTLIIRNCFYLCSLNISTGMERGKRFESLQCLRAIAALLVLWAHIKFAITHCAISGSPAIRSAAGAVGVDVFFVISGFVIALTASKINNDWKLFLVHRIARVVPYFWVVTACFLLIKGSAYFQHIMPAQVFNTLLFLPVLDFGEFVNPLHPYGWTLCFEMWFYLAFASLLFVCKTRAKKVLMVALAILCIGFSLFYKGKWVLPHFIFSPMVIEFCSGMVLYSFYDRLITKRNAIIASILCVAAFVGVLHTEALGWYNHILASAGLAWQRFFVWGTFAFTLALCFLYLEKIKPSAFPRWLKLLGDASYSLYLIQPIILFYALRLSYYTSPWLGGLFFLLGTVFSAILLHRVVEKPLTGFVRKKSEKVFLRKQS